MAEQNLEITYIPYGLDEISLLDLMTSLANGIEGYLGSKRWARKDKYRKAWLEAYLDIIDHGLTGASNETGVWTVNHGKGPIDLNNMSNSEKEMYLDAAYYIRLKMSLMTPRSKTEEKKKEDLEKYGNFETNLMNQILKEYGNNSELFKDSEQGWDAKDARGADGLRGTKNRKDAMIKALSAYKDSLNNKDYNFEGTVFKDKADLQTKIQAAIDALRDTPNDESDDLPAFNALGLRYRSFFSNGGNEASTHLDSKGLQLQLAETEIKEEAEKKKKEIEVVRNNINRYRGIFTYVPNSNTSRIFNFKNANSAEDIVAHVRNNFANINSNDEFRKKSNEILGAYKILGENKKLKPISNETWNTLNMSKKFSEDKGRGLDKSKFMQLEGIDNIVFDSESRKVYYLDKEVPTKKMMDTVLKYRQQQRRKYKSYYFNNTMGTRFYSMNNSEIMKQGGKIKPSLDTVIEDFIKNNNI